jgi:hypothetical protein
MSAEARDRFDRYASEVGLDASELGRLLILRALLRRKLVRRDAADEPISESRRRSRIKPAHRKLTAHFHRVEIVEEFDAYARASKCNRATAARLIFERELTER